jgi:hypothetical protein
LAAGSRAMRILFVCPRFAPVNAADSHRVRLLLPHLVDLGVDVEVLAVDARDVSGPIDPWLEARLPAGVPVHRVRAWPVRGWGTGGLAQRALVPLARAGDAILQSRRFDVVIFSTTESLVQVLGPRWKRRFDVPFCLDYQDPWVSDYYRQRPQVVPPGGRVKFGVMDRVHRGAERRVTPQAAGLLSVSAAYITQLEQRYPAVRRLPRLVRPFPAEPSEWDADAALATAAPSDGPMAGSPRRSVTWQYVGRAGADMHAAFRVFFAGWARARDAGASDDAASMRLECTGTTYAAPSHAGYRPTVTPLAREFGLGQAVTEAPGRIGYREMLNRLRSADALFVPISDDPAYTASKLYPYLLARRPLLIVGPRGSGVEDFIARVGGAEFIGFDPADPMAAIDAVRITIQRGPRLVPLDPEAFAACTAKRQADDLLTWLGTEVLRVRTAA